MSTTLVVQNCPLDNLGSGAIVKEICQFPVPITGQLVDKLNTVSAINGEMGQL